MLLRAPGRFSGQKVAKGPNSMSSFMPVAGHAMGGRWEATKVLLNSSEQSPFANTKKKKLFLGRKSFNKAPKLQYFNID